MGADSHGSKGPSTESHRFLVLEFSHAPGPADSRSAVPRVIHDTSLAVRATRICITRLSRRPGGLLVIGYQGLADRLDVANMGAVIETDVNITRCQSACRRFISAVRRRGPIRQIPIRISAPVERGLDREHRPVGLLECHSRGIPSSNQLALVDRMARDVGIRDLGSLRDPP